jgi:hypothetical protein
MVRFAEPKYGYLVQDYAFIRYACGQYKIESRDAVRGYYQQVVSGLVCITDLALSMQWKFQRRVKYGVQLKTPIF